MDLVTVAAAKMHLRIAGTDHDLDIALRVALASAIVIDYLKTDEAATWTDLTAPLVVQAATLLLIGHLWEHRGDDAAGTMRTHDAAIWEALGLLLVRYRDPAYA